jgi:hypothetical protein
MCIGFVILLISSISIEKSEVEKRYNDSLFKFGIIMILYGLIFSIVYWDYLGIFLPMIFLIFIGLLFINAAKKILYAEERIKWVYRTLIIFIIIQLVTSIFYIMIR